MNFSWNQATDQQLHQIAYGKEEPATLIERIDAQMELLRRKKRVYGRLNNKRKEVYPR